MKLYFSIAFHTKYGEKLQILISEEGKDAQIHTLSYNNNGYWFAEVDYYSRSLSYVYQVVTDSGVVVDQEYQPHLLDLPHNYKEFKVFDFWNNSNFPENYLNNKIFKNKLQELKLEKVSILKKHTHLFRIEAPLYHPNWRMVVLGNTPSLGNWAYEKAIPMMQTALGVWEAAIEVLENEIVYYKYGIMDIMSGEVFDVEYGESRWAFSNVEEQILHIRADHYFKYKAFEMYHAAGVAVPIFSLRSEQGFGVGEFSDLKLLAAWAAEAKLGMIQILPINDTTVNYSWTDSYPYAAISVYALHPLYLNLENLDFKLSEKKLKEYQKEKTELNALKQIDYEKVISGKWKYLQGIYNENQEEILKDRNFKKFLKENEDWLLPYAAFCVQRDVYKTPDFNTWKTHKKYIKGKVASFFSPKGKNYSKAMLHAWVQFQLDQQLSSAVEEVHRLGIAIKGDLPIGIYRNSVEAWTEPELFGMDFQVGAPPDQFTTLGQNWGFPTYNWEAMKKDGYQWWMRRFKVLEKYFDAMRIDHILGFFRIWRMPTSAVQGILGYFYPAKPVVKTEFADRNIQFDQERFCTPFINDDILRRYFGENTESVKNQFLDQKENGLYQFKTEWNTQRKLADYFLSTPEKNLEEKLLHLSANVLFLIENVGDAEVYHPRFNLHKTESYHALDDSLKKKLYDLYLNYFYHRQEDLWYQSAMEKLPTLLNSTNMLICGEDLGLVPKSVPLVMDKLGIIALKVQRMPADHSLWYDPKNASYLNVVTASSHDSSTLRQWWKEDREVSKKYFKDQLNQYGTTPWDLEPGLASMIMKQHLYNDAMLAIFPIQEFFATDREVRNPNEEVERINDPAVFPHYWRYRMHLPLESLLMKAEFTEKIAHWVKDSGRA